MLSTDDITALNGATISAFHAVRYPKKIDFCLFFTRTASNTSAVVSFNNIKCKTSIVNSQYYSSDNVPLKSIVDENGTLLITSPYGTNITIEYGAWVNGTIFLA